jgi:hypothetical protein
VVRCVIPLILLVFVVSCTTPNDKQQTEDNGRESNTVKENSEALEDDVDLEAEFAALEAGVDEVRVELTDSDLVQFTPIAAAIQSASTLKLYEGLPHPGWEPKQLERELATKKTVEIRGSPFYAQPMAVAEEEFEPLRRLCAAKDSYWSYGGGKFCGGFHPDYCLTWTDGGDEYQLLICFGCHEMKLYGPKQELLVDIRDDAIAQFDERLRKHREQRPKPQTFLDKRDG